MEGRDIFVEKILTATLETEDKEVLLDELMKLYGQEVLQLVYSYVKDKTIAEDLTQDIFVKCYRSLDTFKGKSKLKTWLWRIAINQCKDFLKSWYNKNVVFNVEKDLISEGSISRVEEAVVQKDEDDQLINKIMMLPIKYREVIYLFYYEELPIKEIADLTGTGENTVKTRLRRAKDLLKEKLEES
jgi:RNA polymerase sigma-70 factor (ECF subfamily)